MVRTGARKFVDVREGEDRKMALQRLERARKALKKLDLILQLILNRLTLSDQHQHHSRST